MSIAVEDTLVHALHRASQIIEAQLAEALAGVGVTPRQAVMLMAIGEKGNANQTSLVDRTGIDRSTLADVLKRLEKAGLIRRPRSMVDTRARLVSLTEKGAPVEREARVIIEAIEREARARIGKDGAALGRALKALAEDPTAAE